MPLDPGVIEPLETTAGTAGDAVVQVASTGAVPRGLAADPGPGADSGAALAAPAGATPGATTETFVERRYRIRLAPDLSNARVGVRLLAGDDDERERRAALRSLARAGKRIRRALAPRLGLRRFPELVFTYDTGHDATRRVEELLAEIEDERRGR